MTRSMQSPVNRSKAVRSVATFGGAKSGLRMRRMGFHSGGSCSISTFAIAASGMLTPAKWKPSASGGSCRDENVLSSRMARSAAP